MSYYATLDNAKLYYEVRGTGKPVVFIHGWSCSTETFAPIVEELKGKYKCISYDHRGHGASSLPVGGFTITQLGKDLKELIDYLDINDVVLVGHSMGAATIYSYISQFGCERLSKAILIDMSPKLLNDDNWKAGLLSGQYKISDYMNDMDIMSQSMGDFMWKFWRLVLPEFDALPETMKELVAPGLVGINNPHALISLWHSMMYLDYRDSIKNFTIPVAYFIPEKPLYPMETAEFIKKESVYEVDIVEFKDCTHMLPVEKVELTSKAIENFIEKN
jgi:pimeloyl-ACP methyl ester carboxylesterase